MARGSAKQLAVAGSGSGAAERGRGALYLVSPWAGGVWRLFGLAHPARATTNLARCGATYETDVATRNLRVLSTRSLITTG